MPGISLRTDRVFAIYHFFPLSQSRACHQPEIYQRDNNGKVAIFYYPVQSQSGRKLLGMAQTGAGRSRQLANHN